MLRGVSFVPTVSLHCRSFAGNSLASTVTCHPCLSLSTRRTWARLQQSFRRTSDETLDHKNCVSHTISNYVKSQFHFSIPASLTVLSCFSLEAKVSETIIYSLNVSSLLRCFRKNPSIGMIRAFFGRTLLLSALAPEVVYADRL